MATFLEKRSHLVNSILFLMSISSFGCFQFKFLGQGFGEVHCLERVSLLLGAWDGLRYFIVALPEPSI